MIEEPYYAVLWTRWKLWHQQELEEIFRQEFSVTHYSWPVPERFYDFQFGGHLTRYEIGVKADTLHAMLSSIRAVLYQKEPITFTLRDDRLYNKIISMYRLKRKLPFLPKVEEGIKWRLHL